MPQLQTLYLQFLNIFPGFLQPVITLALLVFLVYTVISVIKQNYVYLIALVIFLPAAWPIIKTSYSYVVAFIKFMLGNI